jgi:penicillin-binding protein 1A
MVQNKSWGAGSTLYDIRTDFGGGYRPQDYDLKEPGPLSMRNSLGGSRNIPAIKAMYMAGIQNTQDLAKKLGLKSGVTSCKTIGAEDCGDILSTAIGDGGEVKLSEHVHAFTAFSRMGKVKPQTYVLKIEDKSGKIVKPEWKDVPGEQVLDSQIAYTINDMLSDPSASYFGSSNRLKNFRSALKTGTTNNRENGWIMGYTPHLVFGMWSGHNENKSMATFTESILGPAWNQFMTKAHEGREKKDWVKPTTMKTVCINQTTGYATTSGGKCDIFPSWYTPRYPNNSQKAVIDTVSGKLATECTPEAAKQSITGGGIASELPTSDPNYNNWIKPVQARIGSAGGAIPTDKDDIHSCDPADKPIVSISEPVSNPDGTYSITATATKGKYPLKSLSFAIDGNTLPGGAYDITESGSITYKYTPASSETKTVTVFVTDSVLYDATDSKTVSFVVVLNNNGNNTLALNSPYYSRNRI